MEIIPFVARSAAEAFARIQAQMGPDAVVLNVRQLPARGIARLWQKPQIEVLACPPGMFRSSAPSEAPVALPSHSADVAPSAGTRLVSSPAHAAETGLNSSSTHPSRWKVASLLGSAGFLPLVAQRLLDDLDLHQGERPPATLQEEIVLLRETLRQHWMISGPIQRKRPQVLVGPPGSGKTTLLCKWLTKVVLMEGQPAQVYRMDGPTANTGETLNIHAEILGVPVTRGEPGHEKTATGEWRFVDLPGVEGRDLTAIGELRRSLDKISGAEVHLVLNGAYEVSVLLAQIRAFSSLPISGLMVTHLDEEARWEKLWNLVLSGPIALRFLSAGKHIPGEFMEANPDRVNQRWLGGR